MAVQKYGGSSVADVKAMLRFVKARVRFCETCGNIAESEQRVICVVEEPKDVVAIERTREYRGLCHVLGGAIDPINGVGPDDLRVRELFARVAGVDEVTLGRAFEGRRRVED